MIGYVILGTNDLPRAVSFYDSLLGEIGLMRQMDFGERGYGWGANMDAVMLCVMTPLDGKPASARVQGQGGIGRCAERHDDG